MKVRVSFDDGALGGGKSRIVFVIREWAAKTLTKPDKLTTERAKERERKSRGNHKSQVTESQNHRTTEARITNHQNVAVGAACMTLCGLRRNAAAKHSDTRDCDSKTHAYTHTRHIVTVTLTE